MSNNDTEVFFLKFLDPSGPVKKDGQKSARLLFLKKLPKLGVCNKSIQIKCTLYSHITTITFSIVNKQGAIKIDQSKFHYLKVFDKMAGRSAQSFFSEMEFE